jgi:hypothetical protein
LIPAGRMSPRLPPNARHRASFTSEARYRRSRARRQRHVKADASFPRGLWPSRRRRLPT